MSQEETNGQNVPTTEQNVPATGQRVPTPQAAPPPYQNPVYIAPPVQNPTYIINQQPVKETNGIGTAGFVLALIALFLSWVPVLDWIVWALGLIFSFIGVFRKPKGLAIAGLIISLIVVIIIVAVVGAIATAFLAS
ncbi:MAG: hypothetical protein LBE91_20990 [Tannerella sp.]|jgi:hypothetical protein|nr:hypothetical protein [Tannerella sp.]